MSYTADILSTIDLIACIFAVISGIGTCICLILYFCCMTDNDFEDLENNREYQAARIFLRLSTMILVVCLILCIFIPGDDVLKTWN